MLSSWGSGGSVGPMINQNLILNGRKGILNELKFYTKLRRDM
jgi:hypothetical protein